MASEAASERLDLSWSVGKRNLILASLCSDAKLTPSPCYVSVSVAYASALGRIFICLVLCTRPGLYGDGERGFGCTCYDTHFLVLEFN